MSLDSIANRDDAFDMLEGYSADRQSELAVRKTRRPLVKTYMFETVPDGTIEPSAESLVAATGNRLAMIDNTLHRVINPEQGQTLGFLEFLHPRYPVLYTTEDSHIMDAFAKRLVQCNVDLDNLWISGRLFQEMFEIVLKITPNHRFGRLVFEHTNAFEQPEEPVPTEDDSEPEQTAKAETDARDEAEEYVPERRSTKFSMVDRLDVLRHKLPRMRKIYDPLYSIAQLRFPARGRGGHDFYYHGKVTNRSDSFTDHRQHVQFVIELYRKATRMAEETAWQGVQANRITTEGHSQILVGAPVLLRFRRALSQQTFDAFITSVFRRKINRFRLWGNPIALGPRKVHVYGIDRHVWQSIFLEITDRQIVAIIPNGTCGNSIHRLVTNVQQFLDPGVEVWVGDKEYSKLIESSQGDHPRHEA